MDWKLRLGNFLFKRRSFTPLPLILLVFIIFKPVDLGSANILINLCGFVVSLTGEIIRVIAVGYAHSGTSGRESYLKADALNTTGIYSLVRNPLYIGNFLIFSGLLLVFANIWAGVVVAVFLIAQYYFIILSEEDFLSQRYGKEYENYCGQVRRVIPAFKNYQKAANPFNWRKVIFKESDSVFNMLVMYLLLLLYKQKVFNGSIMYPYLFIIPGAVFIMCYIFIKIAKKKRQP
jgi:protein-S-isoprenylcysteine O-methyltransferase Ste14